MDVKKIISTFALLLTCGLVPFSCLTVDEGNRGIKITLGAADNTPLEPGAHFTWPVLQTIEEVNVQQQVFEETTNASSSDEQQVTTTIAVNYRLKSEKAVECYSELGRKVKTWERVVLSPSVRESLKAVTAEFSVDQLIAQRDVVKKKVEDLLTRQVGDSYFEIMEVSITDFQTSKSYQRAIDAKQAAVQNAQKAKNELEQNKTEVQKLEQQASAEAKATLTRAKARAESLRIESEAEAEAHKRISAAATPASLRQLEIRRWDGKTPLYIGGGKTSVLLPTTK